MRAIPRDGQGNLIQGSGSQIKTFWEPTTGGWDAVMLPPGQDCKVIKINVHDGIEGYSHSSSQEFMYSSESDGSYWDWALDGIIINTAKSSGIICYVKAPAGNQIAITLLA